MATFWEFIAGPGIALLAIGWVAKAVLTVYAFRWWRGRRGENV